MRRYLSVERSKSSTVLEVNLSRRFLEVNPARVALDEQQITVVQARPHEGLSRIGTEESLEVNPARGPISGAALSGLDKAIDERKALCAPLTEASVEHFLEVNLTQGIVETNPAWDVWGKLVDPQYL